MTTTQAKGAARRRLAFVLDYPTLAAAHGGAEKVAATLGVLRIGLEPLVREGPAGDPFFGVGQ